VRGHLPSGRAAASCASLLLAGLTLSACTGAQNGASATASTSATSRAPSPSGAVTQPRTSSSPAGSAWPAEPASPVPALAGALLLQRNGRGPAVIALPAASTSTAHVIVRISCNGPGALTINDAAGRLVLHVAGCSPYAVYGAGPIKRSAADSALTLQIAALTSWRVAVFAS